MITSKLFRTLLWCALTCSALGLTACSEDSEEAAASSEAAGSSVTFSVPSSVDVIAVNEASSARFRSNAVSSLAFDDVGTDYANAGGNFHVSHPVGEALETTSSIMCFLGLLGIENMWSEAALPRVYLAAVNDNCDSESSGPSEGAASGGSGTTATELTMVTVRLSRDAPGSYPRVEIWFSESDGPGGSPMEIRASIDVLQEPTGGNYGKFNLFFSMVSAGISLGGGNLLVDSTSSAPIAFQFYEGFEFSGQTERKGASVEMQLDGSGLKAAVESVSSSGEDSAYVVATNASSVLGNNQDTGSNDADSVADVDLNGGICLSTTNFNYRVYGYGLFLESDGSSVSLNTGVSCQYTDGDGETRNCHIGRHGAWFEDEDDGAEHLFANGDTVTQRGWGDDSANDGRQLTLFVSNGKLNKYTVKKYTLTEVQGKELRLYDNGTEYIIKYLTTADGAASDGFWKTHTMAWDEDGPDKTNITDVALSISNNQFMWFWSDEFGGMTFVGGDTFVTARTESQVAPGNAAFTSGALALKCLNDCPKQSISQANLSSWGGAYETNPANLGASIDYVVTESDMALRKGTSASDAAVALATGVSFTAAGSAYQWGLQSGAMVTSTSGMSDLFSIYDTEGNTYFQYRMGPNNWDKTVLVKDPNGNFLSFDEPLIFDYTHTTANDRNGSSTHNGDEFLLRYNGGGHFDGFPWDIDDRDGDGQGDMWFPQVSLNDGVQLTANSVNYRVKALYGDITLTTTGADCSGLSLSLPSASVPIESSGSPSNISTDKPDHGSCQYDTTTELAVGCG